MRPLFGYQGCWHSHLIAESDPTPNVEIRLVPLFKGKADTTKIDTKLVKGINEYKVGDTMMLWARNTGK